MRRHLRVALATVVGVFVFAAASSAAASGVLDQSQETQTDLSGVSLVGSQFAVQTLTAGRSGLLDQVDLLLTRYGSPGNVTVEIRASQSGTPTGAVLAFGTVVEASLDGDPYTFEWVSVVLSPAPLVTSGNEYAIILRDAGGAIFPSDYVVWANAAANPYARGMALTTTDGGVSWYPSPTTDFAFRTYVALPLMVRGSGFVLQHGVPFGTFAVDMSYDGVTAKGRVSFALPVSYQGKHAYLTASSTSPRLVYVDCNAGKPVSATFSGDGSFVLRSLRGSVLWRGTGYIKATAAEGHAGTLYGYVAPTGPPFMPEIGFPPSTFVGHLDISNAYCPT